SGARFRVIAAATSDRRRGASCRSAASASATGRCAGTTTCTSRCPQSGAGETSSTNRSFKPSSKCRPDPFEERSAQEDPNAWVKIAANFMPWIRMLNPRDIAAWIGRSDIMFRQLPEIDDKVKARVAALDERFPKALNGLSFTETTSLIQFLSLWSVRLTP